MKKVINAVLLRVDWSFKIFLFYFFRIFSIKNNKIVISNYYGKGYGDNAKYIVEELIKTDNELDIVWLLNDLTEKLPIRVRKVKYNSLSSIFEMVTSKVWIDNCRKPIYVRKRQKQYYIQTWHGDIGNKKVENDAKDSLYATYIASAKRDSKMADLFVSGNQWMTEKYKNSFWYGGEVAKCGYPRRDILYNADDKVSVIKNKLNIPENKKICLYAPTFRNPKMGTDLSVYSIEWDKVLNALERRFDGQWVAVVRLHPNISQYSDQLNLSGKVINATNYPDMQELMVVSDVCITDYSSAVYDFAVTQKPGFIYATDLEEYLKDRGTYFTFTDTPFIVTESNKELVSAIENFDESKYKDKHKRFYQDLLGMYEEGRSSEYICDIIRDICNTHS